MDLKDIMSSDAVRNLPQASSKKRLLQTISEQAAAVYNLDASEVLGALSERENLGSTGVGHGVAIPHARFESLDRVYGLFTRLDKPVDFDSIDRQPVDLVFTILAPQNEGAEHLKALALVSRTLRAENICTKLRANNDETTLFTLLTQQDDIRAA
ncbi:PTS lactose transporter subunit IIC [Amylibacter marinus]|uniref:PTS lactose transporter subunit IIC n=1 Tax=Amylibacter marinus TaxID=1475483 RepID=A0ABQ5VWS1_9RHOB|nr:PTS sugar transporter subunit IIA [Amylibacter marinus]GLQ35501.1 PTS lactose transporter subunit IIC [Amylibacter marinus]